MNFLLRSPPVDLPLSFAAAGRRILDVQTKEGAIPWLEGGALDPWNHTEAAMALGIAGHVQAAAAAYDFLFRTQLADGSWWGDYGNALPMEDYVHLSRGAAPRGRDSNFTAYIATGLWHHYLITRERTFLARFWPVLTKAMDFVLSLQSPAGDIAWCVGEDGRPADDALIAGCCSIFHSLDCALAIAGTLGHAREDWARARERLGHALRKRPDRFNRLLGRELRFSMDWYYPVLTGVLTGRAAQRRIEAHWQRFVVEGLGCRCVCDQPWVTVAESCELALALIRIGEAARAQALLDWQMQWRDGDGAFWMGYQYEERIIWPQERPAWTSAAVLLAADALGQKTDAASLFTRTHSQHLAVPA